MKPAVEQLSMDLKTNPVIPRVGFKFAGQPTPPAKPQNRIHNMDIKAFEGELQELAGNIKVKAKLNGHLNNACEVRQTDKGYTVSLNPRRIRSQKQFEEHQDFCREAVTK